LWQLLQAFGMPWRKVFPGTGTMWHSTQELPALDSACRLCFAAALPIAS
jgi:hypothetical protein